MARRYKRSLSDIRGREQEQQQLYREVVKKVKEANRRLEKLERGLKTYTRIKRHGKYKSINVEFEKFGSGTWASRKLFGRIGQYTNGKRIKVSTNMNIGTLRLIGKSTEQFLNSMTSTPKGVKQSRTNVKNALKLLFYNGEESPTDKEIEILNGIFTNEYAIDLMNMSDLKGSEFVVLARHTIDKYKTSRSKSIEKMDIGDLLNPNIKTREEKARDYLVQQLENYGDVNLVNDVEIRETAQKFINSLVDKL